MRASLVVLHTGLDAAGWARVAAFLDAAAGTHPHPVTFDLAGRSPEQTERELAAAHPGVLLCWGVDAAWFVASELPAYRGVNWREGPGGLMRATGSDGVVAVVAGGTEETGRLVEAVE